MKQPEPTTIRRFATEDEADRFMRRENRERERRGREFVCLVAGPDDDWAVVELATAIDLGLGYRWAV